MLKRIMKGLDAIILLLLLIFMIISIFCIYSATRTVSMGVITFVPFLLVLMQPDLGNSIGYLVIFIVVCWFGHINYKYALIGLFINIIVSGSSLYNYINSL
jgi:cell division protein FtsW (lipid II flippase)